MFNNWLSRSPFLGLPMSVGEESACNAGDLHSIPGLGRSPGEGNGNPLQYSCLENPVNRGAWQATVHRVKELDMTFFTFSSLKKKKKNTQKNQICSVWHCPWCKYSPLCLISSYHSDIIVCWSQDKVWRVSSCEPIEAGFSTSLDGYTHCSSTGWIHVTYRSL